jgi:hypothetical protein
MARDIDFSKPLDENDIHYLRQRSWLVDEAELQGFDAIRKQVADGVVEEEEEDDDQSDESDEIVYSEASVAELKAELERRELPTSGNKPELIARLEEDDAADDEEEEEDA